VNNLLQDIIRGVEAGKAQFLTRLLPLTVVVISLAGLYNLAIYCGLDDAQSMDNAQLARQIFRGEGYTTRFLRPQAITHFRNFAAKRSLATGAPAELFPAAQFPKGAPRILPDTYNAPGYPYLLAAWFHLVRPHFDQAISPRLDGFINTDTGKKNPVSSGDRCIPLLNLIFVVVTGILTFFLGRRLFDERVGWLAVLGYFATDLIWQLSLTALSTSFLMFLVTAIILCTVEIFCISENCFQIEEYSFVPAWIWGLLLSLFLAAACLTRLPLLALLVPVFVILVIMPRPSWGMFIVIALITFASVLPWFWHMYKISGNPFGTNAAYLVYGVEGFKENEIFCSTFVPAYDSLLRHMTDKETGGFLWHFENGWRLLGSNFLVLLFFASLLHAYKRRRAQMFQWFLVGTSVVLIAINNFGVPEPEPTGSWNILILLLPGMLVVGSAFFFIQLDRLNLQVWILNNTIVIALIALTAVPLALTIASPPNRLYAFPPYVPPLINVLTQYSKPDEWVTTDMPWATAWYGNRASLWLPDSITDFTSLNDNTCPTGLLLLTPESWSKPASILLSGEYKDWLSLAAGTAPSSTFPLTAHTALRGPEYIIWSDRPRWASQ